MAITSLSDIKVRMARPEDHKSIIDVMADWWDGRDLTRYLPEVFLFHFCDTCLMAEHQSDMVGFLIGFMSQARKNEAYIHFIGIHPDYRKKGLAADLYKRFFETCLDRDRNLVRSATSHVNRTSVAFHESMGFNKEKGEELYYFVRKLTKPSLIT